MMWYPNCPPGCGLNLWRVQTARSQERAVWNPLGKVTAFWYLTLWRLHLLIKGPLGRNLIGGLGSTYYLAIYCTHSTVITTVKTIGMCSYAVLHCVQAPGPLLVCAAMLYYIVYKPLGHYCYLQLCCRASSNNNPGPLLVTLSSFHTLIGMCTTYPNLSCCSHIGEW